VRARLCGGLLIRRAVGFVGWLRWEQRGDEGLSYDLAVAFGWSAALADEQVVEFGRAVGPQDVGGLADGDAGPQEAGVGHAAGVVGHALVAGGADLLEGGGHFGIAGGGVTRQGDDGGGPGAISVVKVPQASEWEMIGTRQDGTAHRMAGVVLFGLGGGGFSWARFYLEPVQAGGASADAAVRQHIWAGAGPADG